MTIQEAMMEKTTEKVTEIIEPVFKHGVGKNGKDWSIARVVTDSGKRATVFNPVVVNDTVELEYNDQYSSWSGKVKKEQYRAQGGGNSEAVLDALRLVYKQNEEILSILKYGSSAAPSEATEPKDGWEAARERFKSDGN